MLPKPKMKLHIIYIRKLVIITDFQHLPYEKYIPYEQFSIFVNTIDVSILPSIIQSYTIKDIENKQLLMKQYVHDITYHSDSDKIIENDAMFHLLQELNNYAKSLRENNVNFIKAINNRQQNTVKTNILYTSSNSDTEKLHLIINFLILFLILLFAYILYQKNIQNQLDNKGKHIL